VDDLNRAIFKGCEYLLRRQEPSEGFWIDELEADSTLTSEYLLLRRFLEKTDPIKEQKAVNYLRDCQLPDGGWNIYYQGPSEISATVKAYFALKLAGISPQEPFMKRARQRVLEMGGIFNANVFTKITLALFGQYDWRWIPTIPVEIMLFPRSFYFNIYEMSYWSRTTLIPLMVITAHRPLYRLPEPYGLKELYPEPEGEPKFNYPRNGKWLSWENFFLHFDTLLKVYEKSPLIRLRRRALEEAHRWIREHMQGEGGLGAIYPAMANSLIALNCLGYNPDHPLVSKAWKAIEGLEVEDDSTLHLQPCHSPVWDTSLNVNALVESGLPRDHPALIRGCEWLLKRQTRKAGDWRTKVPDAEPGGWYFQFDNEFYPDNDDTAVVLMALHKVAMSNAEEKTKAMKRGLSWLLKMQCRDGGWGAFDVDNNKLALNYLPFADHRALLDPSTNDVTGRVLEVLGSLGYGKGCPAVDRAIRFIRKNQERDGPWYGRWGVNYIYGTWSVLAGLRAVGEDMREDYVRRAVAWLEKRQNPDGGWGESCHSYADPEAAGLGKSTPTQTAWALMGLLHAGEVNNPAVRRGVLYLLRTQQGNGSWQEREFTGTGFPRVFYLRYHNYPKCFPLWALSMYRNCLTKGSPLYPARIGMEAEGKSKKALGILAPLRREASSILKELGPYKRLCLEGFEFSIACPKGQKTLLVRTGMGRVNSLQAALVAISRFPLEAIICAGFALSLNPNIKVGDLIAAEGVTLFDLEAPGEEKILSMPYYKCDPYLMQLASKAMDLVGQSCFRGPILTVGKMVTDAEEKKSLTSLHPFLGLDMESATVAQVAADAGIPFLAIRAISDGIDEDIGLDLARCLSPSGSFPTFRGFRYLFAHPHALYRLNRLRVQSAIASRSLRLFFRYFLGLPQGAL